MRENIKAAEKPWRLRTFTILLVANCFGCINAIAASHDVIGTNITLEYSLGGTPTVATITDCNSDASGDLAIPETLGGAPVSIIGSRAFYF